MKTLLHLLLVSGNKPSDLMNKHTKVSFSISDEDIKEMDAGDEKLSLP